MAAKLDIFHAVRLAKFFLSYYDWIIFGASLVGKYKRRREAPRDQRLLLFSSS